MTNTNCVPVYISSQENDARSLLGWFPIYDLDELISIIKQYGCYDGDDSYKHCYAQFFVTSLGKAGFEITVGNDDA